jgi:hypothetical protein
VDIATALLAELISEPERAFAAFHRAHRRRYATDAEAAARLAAFRASLARAAALAAAQPIAVRPRA